MSRAFRPLVVAFLAFLAGTLFALRSAPPPVPFLLLAVVALVVPLLLRVPASLASSALLLALASAGAALGSLAARGAAEDCRLTLPDGAPVRLHGVLGASTRAPPGGWSRSPLLPVEDARVVAGGGECVATVRVRIPDAAPALRAGAEVTVVGGWVRHDEPVVASGWPRNPLYAGFVAAERLTAEPASGAGHPLLAMRGSAEARLQDLFGEHAPLAVALLLGRREGMDPALRDRFARAGLVHLLAISGAHVALLAGMLLLAGGLLRLSRRWVPVGVIAVVALYLGVIGAPGSAVRAGVMVALVLVARLIQRPTAALPLAATAAWVLLAHDPTGALDPGLQLSFAGVLAIVATNRALLPRLPETWTRRAWLRGVVQSVGVSVAAFVATAPIVAHHFGVLAPVSIAANLLAVPLTSLAVAGVVAAGAVSVVLGPVAALLAAGTGVALDAVDAVATYAAAVPYGHFPVVRPPWGVWSVAAVASVAALRAGARLPGRTRFLLVPGVAAGVLLAAPAALPLAAGTLEVHFIDVGQGDAVAIRTPAGRWLLVDAGPRTEGFDAGERRVLPFLRAHGVRRLEALVITHPDADHIGGAPAVVRGLDVARVVEPGFPAGRGLYLELLELLESRDIPWSAAHAGRTLALDGVTLDFLWPHPQTLDGATEANEISAVLHLHYDEFSMLLTGDVSAAVERRLVAEQGGLLRARVLKAGHHGSATSTSDELLAVVEPELVVVSAGRRNRYGHPAPEVLARLERRSVRVARTDREGTVSLRVVEGSSGWTRMEP